MTVNYPSITIETGTVTLAINEDANRTFSFDPTDMLFASRFMALVKTFRTEFSSNYIKAIEDAEAKSEKDADGIPLNADERIETVLKACEFIENQIDELFGEGTSKVVFAGSKSLEAYLAFFNGITPYIESARKTKTGKYTAKGNLPKKRK